MARFPSSFVLVPLLLAETSRATVWTVSPPGGGGRFTDIQSAVNAASAGDTILVFAGSYSPFVLDKALHVLGVGPSLVTVTMSGACPGPLAAPAVVQVTGIPAGAHAVVAGLRVEITTSSFPIFCSCPTGASAIAVGSCGGPVVLSNLVIDPGYYYHGVTSNPSNLLLVDHAVVSAPQPSCPTLCTYPTYCAWAGLMTTGTPISLNDSSILGSQGSTALRVIAASASVARTSLFGADGFRLACAPGGLGGVYLSGVDGGRGLEALVGSSVRVARGAPTAVFGGNGGAGDGGTFCNCSAGDGGNAVTSSASSILLTPGLPLLPGIAGFPDGGCPGVPGVATSGAGITTSTTTLPSLGVSPVLASVGGSVSLDVKGGAGFLYGVGVAAAPSFLALPGVGGPLLLDPLSLGLIATGVLDATGSASLTLPVPPDPNLSGFVGFLQVATSNPPSAALDLSPAAVVVVL